MTSLYLFRAAMRPVFKTTINMHLARSNFVSLVGAHFPSSYVLNHVMNFLIYTSSMIIDLSYKNILKAKSNFTLFIFEYNYTRSDFKLMEHCH